jgi:hypothetical protein
MGSERCGKLLVVSQHLRGFIEVLLVASIAPDGEVALQSRRRRIDIRLGKRDSMLVEKILSTVKPIVFAHHHPAVIVIFPHTSLL